MKNVALINARKKANLSQEKLADIMGCKKTTISNWENGYSIPRLKDAFMLSHVLKADINDLFLCYKVQETHTNNVAFIKKTTKLINKIS
ncbi:helix-turn-helix transcriptional regulator [Desertibacillus haloalkaliphilus]|uniref:helix-turn-helix transcriptional regulator n=1 Tax=Desertibacillus haloalkaliphilus TaxID=1328930 RepID=UPI001C274EB4|nr:helix-turn-helix transcriptional regulator [Desertibacillus haloalkaliphilus]MBU8905563.1 helix-turn-helix domain-containing protein [Desertibacillus haloalkaliphilus]